MQVTEELLDRARLLNACSDLPVVGTDVLTLPVSLALWVENKKLLTSDEIAELCSDPNVSRGCVQVSFLARTGCVYNAYGSGSRSGGGYGTGTGAGYGCGVSDGDGFGHWDWFGHGDNDVNLYGVGDITGKGYGDGDGMGYGDGDDA